MWQIGFSVSSGWGDAIVGLNKESYIELTLIEIYVNER